MRLALVNGNIITLNDFIPYAKSLLIKDGKIEAIDEHPPSDYKIINLSKKTVIPGFIDSHTHINVRRLSLRKSRNLKDAYELIREKLKVTKGPLIAVDWDESRWEEGGFPKKEELDLLSPNRALILRRVCGHIAVCNTKALEFISPKWKRVDFKNGILLEDVVLYLNDIFPPTEEEIISGIEEFQKEAEKLGITSVHLIMSPQWLKICRKFHKEKRLGVRVYAIVPVRYRVFPKIEGDEWLKTGGIKLFADGSFGAKTAALKTPYKNSENYGILIYNTGKLKNIVKNLSDRGFQVCIHAIGDSAISQVLEVYSKIDCKDRRHRIEHFELAGDENIKKAKKLGIILSMQPNFVNEWGMPGGMYENILGEKRARTTNRFELIRKSGAKICFGSDSMPMDPIYGIKGAIKRGMSPLNALKSYTINSAYASFDEDIKGSIEIGKLADLAVLSDNILENQDIKIESTIVGGNFL